MIEPIFPVFSSLRNSGRGDVLSPKVAMSPTAHPLFLTENRSRVFESAELTRLLGKMMTKSGKPQTFSDLVEALVRRFIILLPEPIKHVEEFVEANKQLGYATRKEFIREVVNETLRVLSNKYKEPEQASIT
jgi:hypothetical protein